LIAWLVKYFANQAVAKISITNDKKFVFLQTHTILGLPGSKYQVPVGNVTFVVPFKEALEESKKKKFFSSAYLPMKIEGLKGNYLVEADGFKDTTTPLMLLLEKNAMDKSDIHSKENRMNYFSAKKSKGSKK
jgi:hypothetical protein